GLAGLLVLLALALAGCGGEPPEVAHRIWLPAIVESYRYEGGKAGVGIISNNRADWAQPGPDDARMVGADWHYNWSIDADLRGSAQAHGEFVPMVWGGREREIGAL
ncbi:glycosyl hydrolase, partial [Arthrospira platensis SPKY1]|nr:glycosyl hydrolase [Arthrospira platensis SPKY1]